MSLIILNYIVVRKFAQRYIYFAAAEINFKNKIMMEFCVFARLYVYIVYYFKKMNRNESNLSIDKTHFAS